jgi:histidine triad (HIT) family protein
MSSDCIFCKIVKGEIPSKKVYENEKVLVFEDISPQAPFHWLIIPKLHVEDFSEAVLQKGLLDEIGMVIRNLTEEKGIKNYRLVTNRGKEAGQEVFHFHVHLLAGRKMEWPPG